MKTRRVHLGVTVMLLLAVSTFYACQKETSATGGTIIPAGSMNLSVYLTDGPYDFQQVLVDIQGISVKLDTCHRHGDEDNDDDEQNESNSDSNKQCVVWTPLDIQPGVYDLLQLRNGLDTLLGETILPEGKIRAVKIMLGTNNSVMADSVVSPLKFWQDKNYVILKIRNEHLDSVAANNFQVLLDFDIAKSIRYENGSYYLRPGIRPFCRKNTGSIEGMVQPDSAYGLITAILGTDSSFALPDHHREGKFKIRGLQEGVYQLLLTGKNGYADSTISNITVQKGRETDLGRIRLHK